METGNGASPSFIQKQGYLATIIIIKPPSHRRLSFVKPIMRGLKHDYISSLSTVRSELLATVICSVCRPNIRSKSRSLCNVREILACGQRQARLVWRMVSEDGSVGEDGNWWALGIWT